MALKLISWQFSMSSIIDFITHLNAIFRCVYYFTDTHSSGVKPFVYFPIHTFGAAELCADEPWLRLPLRADELDQVFESVTGTHVPS